MNRGFIGAVPGAENGKPLNKESRAAEETTPPLLKRRPGLALRGLRGASKEGAEARSRRARARLLLFLPLPYPDSVRACVRQKGVNVCDSLRRSWMYRSVGTTTAALKNCIQTASFFLGLAPRALQQRAKAPTPRTQFLLLLLGDPLQLESFSCLLNMQRI